MKYTIWNTDNLENMITKNSHQLYLNSIVSDDTIFLDFSKDAGQNLYAVSDVNYDEWFDFFEDDFVRKEVENEKSHVEKIIKKNVQSDLFRFIQKK